MEQRFGPKFCQTHGEMTLHEFLAPGIAYCVSCCARDDERIDAYLRSVREMAPEVAREEEAA